MWDRRLRGFIGQLVLVQATRFTIEGLLGNVQDGPLSYWTVSGRGQTIATFGDDEIVNVFDLPEDKRCVLKIVLGD